MSCRSGMLKQQRHQDELCAEPIQVWLSSLAKAAAQTRARFTSIQVLSCSTEYECILLSLPNYPYAVLPGELGSKVQMDLRGFGMELGLLTPDWTHPGLWWGTAQIQPGCRTVAELTSVPCGAEHAASVLRLNQHLPLSTMQHQASVWTLAALSPSALLRAGTQHRHTQTGIDLVQQGLTRWFHRVGMLLECVQVHTQCWVFRVTLAPEELLITHHCNTALMRVSTGLPSPASLRWVCCGSFVQHPALPAVLILSAALQENAL